MEISIKCATVEELREVTSFLYGCIEAEDAVKKVQAQADKLAQTGELESALKNAQQKG